MKRSRPLLFALLLTLAIPLGASDVKVAGESFIPEGLILGEADPKNRTFGEGELSDGCTWELNAETRIGRHRVEREKPEEDCFRYYYVTTARLVKKCPAPAVPETGESERITTTGPHCPAANGTVEEAKSLATPVSEGRIPDGRFQTIVRHPDGTRFTIRYDLSSVEVAIVYPDGTADVLGQIAKKPPEE
ncbi:MAG: hypothetical protein KY459_14160 [Acidobacteria bacterium]|nr:hypothetical protein [Acidobacteriota bacterium]